MNYTTLFPKLLQRLPDVQEKDLCYNYQKSNPIDLPLILSGNFGEIRGTHFHAGIDIKTNAESGLKVYSINDGYVYRIKISH